MLSKREIHALDLVTTGRSKTGRTMVACYLFRCMVASLECGNVFFLAVVRMCTRLVDATGEQTPVKPTVPLSVFAGQELDLSFGSSDSPPFLEHECNVAGRGAIPVSRRALWVTDIANVNENCEFDTKSFINA